MTFGTGAVKITPAHDPNDFKTGQRHNLPRVNVFDDTGTVNKNGGPFEGQPRFMARRTIVEFLEVRFHGDVRTFMVKLAGTCWCTVSRRANGPAPQPADCMC